MSDIRVDTISAANGTDPVTLTKQSAAKAWVSVSISSPAINDSLNVSSLNDLGTGQTEMVTTNSFKDGNSSFTAINRSSSQALGVYANSNTSAKWVVYTRNSSSAFTDFNFSSTVHGDLA